MNTKENELFEALAEVPMIDVHTHLRDDQLSARGLHDILLYHMSISDLYASGYQYGQRLSNNPDCLEVENRLKSAMPYLLKTMNTSIRWGVQLILKDLYGWEKRLSEDNWQEAHQVIKDRSEKNRALEIFKTLNIKRIGTEYLNKGKGKNQNLFQYALEWGFFARKQWGFTDTPLYELERCWGKQPSTPTEIGLTERDKDIQKIKSIEDVESALHYYVDTLPEEILSIATHISADYSMLLPSDAEFEKALSNREDCNPDNESIYASYIHERFLSILEEKRPDIVFQFSYGAEPMPYETMSRSSEQSIKGIAEFIHRHPDLKFQCFLASAKDNQGFCTMCRELPNFSLAGFWWHNFFPSIIETVMDERLDMLPLNQQIGFFSDAYFTEWVYAKAIIVRHALATNLEKRINRGQVDTKEALYIAREILFESPQDLLRFKPSQF
ncbi:MAG: hypothetical protein COA79_19230 [Planctomycetota bacterium]|nr:MAG: hypothetical protein COA79_19230 [Planctomycetota bacterium]